MMRTPSSLIARHAAGVTLLLIAAACSSGSDEAARTDTAAAAAASATSAPNMPATTPAGSLDSAAGTTGDSAARAAGAATTGAMLDPNTATKEQLAAVPGMTAAAADALVAGRPFRDMVAVDQALAKSITSADARKQVYAKLWKPIDLNSAKGEEILLIPGVGPRMRHEFEEYRPYKNIEQFRREIGKYVDKDEVARLEQYVAIKQ
jgi:DNA uptake protein ComE-like DNA-binding protein